MKTETRKCEVCGKEFRTFKNKTTCSLKCEYIKEGRVKLRICKICGKEFKTHKDKVVCSSSCDYKLKKLNEGKLVCKHCGKLFSKSKVHIEFCSAKCKKNFGKHTIIKQCPVCGKEFTSINHKTFCSKYCFNKHYYLNVTLEKRKAIKL